MTYEETKPVQNYEYYKQPYVCPVCEGEGKIYSKLNCRKWYQQLFPWLAKGELKECPGCHGKCILWSAE